MISVPARTEKKGSVESTELSITPNSASGLYLTSFFRPVCATSAAQDGRKSHNQGISHCKYSQKGQQEIRARAATASSQIFLYLFPRLSSFCALKRWVDFQRMKPGNHPWDTGRQNFLERREGRTSLVLPHSVSAPSAPPAAKLSLNPIISGIKNSISAKVVQRGSDSFTVPQHSPFPV